MGKCIFRLRTRSSGFINFWHSKIDSSEKYGKSQFSLLYCQEEAAQPGEYGSRGDRSWQEKYYRIREKILAALSQYQAETRNAKEGVMRITNQIPHTLSSPSTIGRSIQAGATRSPSVEISDVLEFSGLSKVARSLGARGIQALQTLAGQGGIEEGRLLAFVENLSQSGTSSGRTGDILSQMAGFLDPLGSTGLGALFGEVEKRGPSGELEYLDSIDSLLNLGYRSVPSLFASAQNLSDEDFDLFLKNIADLLQRGVVGTVTVDVDGSPTKVFLSNEAGSEYAREPLYQERFRES